jgi:hypothetical protein
VFRSTHSIFFLLIAQIRIVYIFSARCLSPEMYISVFFYQVPKSVYFAFFSAGSSGPYIQSSFSAVLKKPHILDFYVGCSVPQIILFSGWSFPHILYFLCWVLSSAWLYFLLCGTVVGHSSHSLN